MANVMFKRGTNAELIEKVQTGNKAQDGIFYLTTDTNRLYVGNDSGGLVELNQSITMVDSIGSLPTNTTEADLGQYYYIKDANVLACYTGEKTETNPTGWIQINPDTTLFNNEQNIIATLAENKVTIKNTIADTVGNESIGSFTIEGQDAIKIGGTFNEETKINDITITAHDSQYGLSTSSTDEDTNIVKLNLTPDTDSSDEGSTVEIAGGTNISVTQANDKITISASDAADMTNTDIKEWYTTTGKHVVSVKDSNGTITNINDDIIPTIKYGKNNETSAVFKGTSDEEPTTAELNLDVYTRTEVDNIVKAADALHYKGILSQAAADTLKITEAQLGDVYKASENINNSTAVTNGTAVGLIQAHIGDLIIAYGTEGDNGYLTSSATWDVIPSGDDQLLKLVADKDNNKLSLVDNNDSDVALGFIQLKTDEKEENINITSETDSEKQTLITTIKHSTAGVRDTSKSKAGSTADQEQAEKQTVEFTAITSVDVDKNGHVVALDTKKLTVVDTHNELTAVKTESSDGSATGSVKVTTTVTTTDDGGVSDSFELKSETLTLTQANDTISAELVWGSF